jgi:hypothetical protein
VKPPSLALPGDERRSQAVFAVQDSCFDCQQGTVNQWGKEHADHLQWKEIAGGEEGSEKKIGGFLAGLWGIRCLKRVASL